MIFGVKEDHCNGFIFGLMVDCSQLVVSCDCCCFDCHQKEECILNCQLLVGMHIPDMVGDQIMDEVKKCIWI